VQEFIGSTKRGDGEFNTRMRYGTFAATGGGEAVETESLMGGQTTSLEVKYSSQHRRRVRTMGPRVYAWVDCMRKYELTTSCKGRESMQCEGRMSDVLDCPCIRRRIIMSCQRWTRKDVFPPHR